VCWCEQLSASSSITCCAVHVHKNCYCMPFCRMAEHLSQASAAGFECRLLTEVECRLGDLLCATPTQSLSVGGGVWLAPQRLRQGLGQCVEGWVPVWKLY
jgi:hypothetical protein